MASPHIIILDEIEWGSASHSVMNLSDNFIRANIFDHTSMTPIAAQDRDRVGVIYVGPFSFDSELAGSGTAGTAPEQGELLKACGFKYTNVPASPGPGSDTYLITKSFPTDFEAETINILKGNAVKTVATNCACNLTLTLRPGEPGSFTFECHGKYTEPSEATVGPALVTRAVPPVCKGLTITIGGNTIVLKELVIALNGTIQSPRTDITGTNGVQNPIITNIQPTFTATLEYPDLSNWNIWNEFTTETKGALAAVLGSAAGNICTIACDGYMNAPPVETNLDGILGITVSYRMSWAAADQQLQFIYT